MQVKLKTILIAAAAAIVVGIVLVLFLSQLSNEALDVKFVSFALDRNDIKVGETANLLFNVQNSENMAIGSARVIVVIQPSGNDRYFSLSNNTVALPAMFSKDARTGEIKVSITAIDLPAKEAVYSITGILYVGTVQTDSKTSDLKVHAS